MVRGDLLDHICSMVEECMDGGATFEAALAVAAGQLPPRRVKYIERLTLKLMYMETTFKPRTVFWAMLPWLLMLSRFFVLDGVEIPWLSPLVKARFVPLLAMILMFVQGGVGWRRNWPRWTFPVLGMVLWCVYWVTYWIIRSGMHKGNWVALGVCLAIVVGILLLNLSVKPLRSIGRQVWDDPWLALFAISPLLVLVLPGLLPGPGGIAHCLGKTVSAWNLIPSSIVLLSFAWGFYRFLTAPDRRGRVVPLVLSLALITIVPRAWTLFVQPHIG